jgi:hypothetical protein
METDSTIGSRLKAVEEAVAEIKQKLEAGHPASDWLNHVIGSFADEPEFDEVIRLGREDRMADRPVAGVELP